MSARTPIRIRGHQYPSLTVAAKALGISKQRLWQLRRKAAGKCLICGRKREEGLAERCKACNAKWAAYRRRVYKLGHQRRK